LPFQNNNVITKTTVVTVDSSGSKEGIETMPWSKKLDITPERIIEDRD
jgi:hypothetical protein